MAHSQITHFLIFLLCVLSTVTVSLQMSRQLVTPPKGLQLSKIIVDNTRPGHPFVDRQGRVRVFHGINRVQKGVPWYPALLLNGTHIDQIASWGFNVIRLGMMWSGVEIGPFKINETYLNIMDNIVKSLSMRGIYVILDMHQDGLSSEFNMYDGAPKWLIDSLPSPTMPFPFPFPSPPSNWNFNYVTLACGEAFENIYNNQSQALDHLGFFWGTVAKRFGHYDNVLGYEIINEPWPGNVYADPLLFIPGHAGSTVLQPFYDKIIKFIRAVDTETLVFYEPVTWGMILHGSELGSGFTHVPGGDAYRNHSVLSFHYYCWFAGNYSHNPFPSWLRELCDGIFFPDVLSSVSEDIEQTGGGKFLTEFGLCEATAPHNSTEYQECLSVLTTTDAATVSWTYWDSVFYSANGSIVTENVKLFSRPYAMAIAGEPIQSSFDSVSGLYALTFNASKNIATPTIIYASPLHYPNGFTVHTSNANYTVLNSNYIQIIGPSSSPPLIKVLVSRKK